MELFWWWLFMEHFSSLLDQKLKNNNNSTCIVIRMAVMQGVIYLIRVLKKCIQLRVIRTENENFILFAYQWSLALNLRLNCVSMISQFHIKVLREMGTSFALHLIMMNFHYIDENKIIYKFLLNLWFIIFFPLLLHISKDNFYAHGWGRISNVAQNKNIR